MDFASSLGTKQKWLVTRTVCSEPGWRTTIYDVLQFETSIERARTQLHMNIVKIKWISAVDEDEVQEAMKQAMIDCYGESEQCMGLTTMAAESLAFPFATKVLDEAVEVIDPLAPSKIVLGSIWWCGTTENAMRSPHTFNCFRSWRGRPYGLTRLPFRR
jgi:hypothetical protein